MRVCSVDRVGCTNKYAAWTEIGLCIFEKTAPSAPAGLQYWDNKALVAAKPGCISKFNNSVAWACAFHVQ